MAENQGQDLGHLQAAEQAAAVPVAAPPGPLELFQQQVGDRFIALEAVLNQITGQMQQLAPFLQQVAAAPGQAAAAAAAGQHAEQEAQAAAAAAAQAAQQAAAAEHAAEAALVHEAELAQQAVAAVESAAAQTAAARVAVAQAAAASATPAAPRAPVAGVFQGSQVKAKYMLLTLATGKEGKEISGRLNQPLDSWRTATEMAFGLNRVPPEVWLHTAIMNAMSGHVQAVALSMFSSGLLSSWGDLLDQMRVNFEPHEQRRLAAAALESLQMRGDTVAALERFIAGSRELHIAAGDLVTEERRWEYFMRGLPEEIGLTLAAVITTSAPHTFEAATKLALGMLGSRVRSMQPPSSSQPASSAATPMDVSLSSIRNAATAGEALNALRQAGWWKGKPSGKPSGTQGGQPSGSTKPRWRATQQAKGSRPQAGRWMPNLQARERKQLMEQGKCLCCKVSTAHTWRDCPRNPDNRGNV
jgi:hypothetical protein